MSQCQIFYGKKLLKCQLVKNIILRFSDVVYYYILKQQKKTPTFQQVFKIYLRFWFFYSCNKTSKILIAASLILVPGPKTATAPASNKNW